MDSTKDKNGTEVKVGDQILVHEIDSRITEYLPKDEVEDLQEFVNSVFTVNHINSDGSMVVAKEWKHPGSNEIMGHELAIFPEGAELMQDPLLGEV